MQAKQISRTGVRLKYENGNLTCDTPINVMGPRGPEQYTVNWKVTWEVNTPVSYKGKEYTIDGYELAHDNQGGMWPDVVLKAPDDLLLRVDPIACMDGNPPTWVHNLGTVETANVEFIENVEFTESNVDSGT